MALFVKEHGWHRPVFDTFSERILDAFGEPPPDFQAQVGLMKLRDATEVILEMRPFLLDPFRPEKFALELANGHFIAWTWIIRSAFILMTYVENQREIVALAQTGSFECGAVCNWDGVFTHPRKPWVSILDFEPAKKRKLIWINCCLLDLLFEKLFAAYGQIDFEAIRTRTKQKLLSEPVSDDEFALACADVDLRSPEPQPVASPIPRKVRLSAIKLPM